ncbi:MAG: hypothetical protein JSW15_08705, partial [Deltaproteobacteria bacterium]
MSKILLELLKDPFGPEFFTLLRQNAPPGRAGPVEFPGGNPIQQGGDEWHPLTGTWGSLFKPATICPVVVGTAPKSNIIRLRLNTLQLAAGMKGKVDRAV